MFSKEKSLDYDKWYETPLGSFVDEIESQAAFSLFSPPAGAAVLDAGCGTGNFSIKLAHKGYQVTGIDISGEMLIIAEQKAALTNLNITFAPMDINNLGFPDHSFPAVLSMAAFEFIQEPHKAYQELYRVVKPGGLILIGTINRDSLWGQTYIQMAAADKDSVFNYAYFMNMEELKDLDRPHLLDSRECLFIPPTAMETDFNQEKEAFYSKQNKGGFIICLWQKPY